MTTSVALLRSVNLGPTRRLIMSELRRVIADAGFDEVATIAHTGNILFRASGEVARMEQAMSAAIAEHLQLKTEVFIRSAAAYRALIAANPFPRQAEQEPSRLTSFVLRAAPEASAIEAVRAAIVGGEALEAVGADLYVYYPDGQGTSKSGSAFLERKLKTLGTMRNWNTVLKIGAALGEA